MTNSYFTQAELDFPNANDYLIRFMDSVESHDMHVNTIDNGFRSTSRHGGEGCLTVERSRLKLTVRAVDPDDFSRIRHTLTSLITFIARREQLSISWNGDSVGCRLPADLRVLTVKSLTPMPPAYLRIRFQGEDLHSFADTTQLHCRLLFQEHGTINPEWPMLDEQGGIVWPRRQGRLASRIYTIRNISADEGWIDIDFHIHKQAGPATKWAQKAAAGDICGILGPAAFGPKPANYYILAGDETGLPGIARILEILPDSATGVAFVELDRDVQKPLLKNNTHIAIIWLSRKDMRSDSPLVNAVKNHAWPVETDGLFYWGGYEYDTHKTINRFLRQEIGLKKENFVSFSYWRRHMSEDDIVEIGGDAISD
ncbi:siderophore-interacting protein [Advenella sp. FME57]|uniref:siderophore-interacting protein n=1 Tax=Advenella sp. FME57 TaxID=2742604 RepID=UPI001869432D|nr:siderophore-interacting protein [Advenella sp. FME57]